MNNIYIFGLTLLLGIYFISSIVYKTYMQKEKWKIGNFTGNNKLIYLAYGMFFTAFILLLISTFFTDYSSQNNNQKSNTKVLFLLDVSKSMKALDYSATNKSYSRLDAAKKWISNFATTYSSFSIGLNVFAGDVVGIMPIMNDTDNFLTFLYGVDENNVTKQGTDIYGALEYSVQRFDDKDNSQKIIFLISDGGDEVDKKDYSKIKLLLDKQKIKLYVIGIGNKKGSFIPESTDYFGKTTYKTYNGKKVITKLNTENLENISSRLNSVYSEISKYDDSSYNSIIGDSNNLIHLNTKETRVIMILSYILFLGFAILFFYNKYLGRK